MRIVDVETFKTLPAGTVFTAHSLNDWTSAGLEVKQTGPGDMQSAATLSGISAIANDSSDDLANKINAMEADSNSEFPVDLDCGCRMCIEGYELYMIYSRDDVNALIDRLQAALKGQ